MNENNTRGLYVTEKIKNLAYNFKYKAIALIEQYSKEAIMRPYQVIYLLGIKYEGNPANIEQVNLEVFTAFQNIIWITYRSGFPSLLEECHPDQSYVTDTGWGCMIRVGQMLFAQILKTFLNPKTKEEFANICQNFNDFKSEATFSIQKIAHIGRKDFNLKPGEWYNPSQIGYILSGLLNGTKNPKFKNLRSIVFNNANLFFDQLLEEMLPVLKECHHNIGQNLVCQMCNEAKRQLAVIVLVRIGLDKPETNYLQILNAMMEFKYFRGLIGGKPQKALYFVGKQDQDYIYLDPHYVQNATENISENKTSYFCESFRRCKNTSIDPSLGICFYLKDLRQLNQFYGDICELRSKSQDFFIYMARQTPSYLKKEQNKNQDKQENSDNDEFQMI